VQVRINPRKCGVMCTALAAALSLLLAAAGTAAAATTLRIAYNPNATNTSIVVAVQQGYFAQHGLNVQLTTSADTTALLPAIGKQFDLVGAGPTSILQFAQQGNKPVLVGAQNIANATTDRNDYLLADKNITTLSQLAGQTVGVTSLSGTMYDALLYQLQQIGISASQVKFLVVPFADEQSDLQSGAIQATITIQPFASTLLSAGYSDLGDPVEQTIHDQTALSIGWVGYRPWVESHPKVIAEFDAAQEEALKWMAANEAGCVQILETDFQLSAVAAQKYPVTQYVAFKVKPTYLSDWVAPLKAIGALPKSFKLPISQLVYTPPSPSKHGHGSKH